MQLTTIPFEKTGKFSKLILDYINKPKSLSEFIENEVSLQNFKTKISEREFSQEKRNLLVAQLASQYEAVGLETPGNVSLLLNENSFTVITGHQLCLLGGPQYFIHKIVSCIKLSQQLKEAFPENDFAPVFWLASEDHDFEEINSVNLFGKELKTETNYSGPVGRLEANIYSNVIKELEEILGEAENDNELKKLFSDAYSKGSLANAVRIWVNELFKDFGVIIIDGDDVELKRSFSSIVKDELLNRESVGAIQATSGQLKRLGYSAQVTPRDINLFYIEDGLRERIVFENNAYSILNTNLTFSEDEILELLKSNPEKFSPNAVMRPIYEEAILPNLAYIGGPGEIAYWLQLKSNFERLGIDFPLLVVRDSFLLPNTKLLNAFLDMGFDIEDVFKDEHELLKGFLKRNSDSELHFDKEEAMLKELNQVLLDKIEGVDKSLSGMVNAELSKVNKLFDKLETKLIKAQKNKEEVSVNKIIKFRNTVLPNDVLVERFESFIPTYLKYGKEYITWLVDCSNVFDSKLKVILE